MQAEMSNIWPLSSSCRKKTEELVVVASSIHIIGTTREMTKIIQDQFVNEQINATL